VVRLSTLRTCRLYTPGDIPGTHFCWGTAVAQRLRYCAANQNVAGSIPDGVMEFFIDINPSDRTLALGVDSASNRNEYQENFLG
jgi:hypothetical protein